MTGVVQLFSKIAFVDGGGGGQGGVSLHDFLHSDGKRLRREANNNENQTQERQH